jgi:hypothetical protein
VTIRKRLARTAAGTLILLAALISAGLTAPADGPFTIDIKPVFLRLDASSLDQSRAGALGFDIDIRIATVHLHFAWSAVSMASLTTPALSERQRGRARVEGPVLSERLHRRARVEGPSTKEPRGML